MFSGRKSVQIIPIIPTSLLIDTICHLVLRSAGKQQWRHEETTNGKDMVCIFLEHARFDGSKA